MCLMEDELRREAASLLVGFAELKEEQRNLLTLTCEMMCEGILRVNFYRCSASDVRELITQVRNIYFEALA